MRQTRALALVFLVLVAAVVGVSAVWLWTGGEQTESGHSASVRVEGDGDVGQSSASALASVSATSPAPDQCEHYLHWSNLDAGCLEPSGSLTATIDSQILDTTGAHVTCELDGKRLEISVDTLERLDNQGSFWAVLWGEEDHFDVLEVGVGYGRRGPRDEAMEGVYYRKDDSSSTPPPLTVTRDGRTLTISGTRPPIFDKPALPVTMTVTCPADF